MPFIDQVSRPQNFGGTGLSDFLYKPENLGLPDDTTAGGGAARMTPSGNIATSQDMGDITRAAEEMIRATKGIGAHLNQNVEPGSRAPRDWDAIGGMLGDFGIDRENRRTMEEMPNPYYPRTPSPPTRPLPGIGPLNQQAPTPRPY